MRIPKRLFARSFHHAALCSDSVHFAQRLLLYNNDSAHSSVYRTVKWSLTHCRQFINRTLVPLNLKLETRRAGKEEQRLTALRSAGYFSQPAFPIPRAVSDAPITALAELTSKYRIDLDRLNTANGNSNIFSADNGFFFPPDSDVLYMLVREFAPAKIIEVGSGNSTHVIRHAISDGHLETHLISIDPEPRQLILPGLCTRYDKNALSTWNHNTWRRA